MATHSERQTVAGIFENEATASKALEKLVEARFDIEADVNVMVSKGHDRQTIPIWSDVPDTRGALSGAGIGIVLAATTILVSGIDFGPFSLVDWGPAFAAFEAAFAAGCIGMVIGLMMSFEFAHPNAAFHLARFHDGVVWVGVKAAGARADLARKVLTEAGARHFVDHRADVVAA
jgi:hypothetical protein